jgi:hypothetical protein
MTKIHLFFTLATLALFLSLSGCLAAVHDTGAHPLPASPPATGIMVDVVHQHPGWSPSEGCYWNICFLLENPGNTCVQNLSLQVQMVDADTGDLEKIRNVSIGAIGPGDSCAMNVTIDGDCLKQYIVHGIPFIDGQGSGGV